MFICMCLYRKSYQMVHEELSEFRLFITLNIIILKYDIPKQY